MRFLFYLLELFFQKDFGGAEESPIDARDLMFEDIVGAPDDALPSQFQLDYDFPIKNQRRAWSCVGQSASSSKQFQEEVELSARFAYRKCKDIDGFLGRGTYLRIGAKIIQEFGICREELIPEEENLSDESYLNIWPSKQAIDNADKHKSKVYMNVGSDFGAKSFEDIDYEIIHENIKRAVYEYRTPVIMGCKWYPNYVPDKIGNLPFPMGSPKFGHAFIAIGWTSADDLICVNSWGEAWGNKGKFLLRPAFPKFNEGWIHVDEDQVPIEIPPKRVDRNIVLEQQKALQLRNAIYSAFDKKDEARKWAGRHWFELVNAFTYKGYSAIDLINQIYAGSRKLDLPFNLTQDHN